MFSLGALAFASPWILGALAALPVLWWLIRITPPTPRRVAFPAIRLLAQVVPQDRSPARTPWWLLLLRLALAALVIVALAGPILHPEQPLAGRGPLVLVVDNGWAAARDWPARQQAMGDLIARAGREARPVTIVTTAPDGNGDPPRAFGPMRADDAGRLAQTLAPHPWPVDRAAAARALAGVASPTAAAVWLSDGITAPGTAALARVLAGMGISRMLLPPLGRLPHLLMPPPDGATAGLGLSATLVRAAAGAPENVEMRALAADGRLLGSAVASFAPDASRAVARIAIPDGMANQATRLQIADESSAGATLLLDQRWQRRPVGLVSGRPSGQDQPLLGDLYYLRRALEPFAELRSGTIETLLAEPDLSVLMLADVGALTPTEISRLGAWVGRGGVLVRFAGPRMARASDSLVPVRLRGGDRALGGVLSWAKPAHLAPFPASSPFAGLKVPADVTVSRQVLAEPSLDLGSRTWATLSDGTPLVTGVRRGKGELVLVHTTANPDWSNLALSGLFVEMLRRLSRFGTGFAVEPGRTPLRPVETLDGFARLTAPPAGALAIVGPAPRVDARHPPGYYGSEGGRVALNLASSVTGIAPITGLPARIAQAPYGAGLHERDLQAPLLAAALALALVDLAIGLLLGGGIVRPGRRDQPGRRTASWLAACLLPALAFGLSGQARAAGDAGQPISAAQDFAMKAADQTTLGYVRTGDPAVDAETEAGLKGLATVLAERTSVDNARVTGVNVETDELSVFPLLYWVVTPTTPTLSDHAKDRVNFYLHHGGMILFDTEDQQYGGGTALGGGPGGQRLKQLVQGLDIPPLEPVPPDHVLTKSFYLLQDFPGRYIGGSLWVEAGENPANDGVSSVIVGSNDWAGAWAVDAAGHYLNAVTPGGERQREFAYRFGVNLVMYALTGNYKADQVHVPAILERLGQ